MAKALRQDIMNRKAKSKKKRKLLEGVIRKAKGGFGFLEHEDYEKDIFIRRSHMKDAMEGDVVEVELIPMPLWENGPEGFVVNVKERAVIKVVGTLDKSGKNGFLIPMENRLKEDIFIPHKWLHGARHGDKLIVKIKRYPSEDRLAEGEVVEIIAKADDSDKDIKAIISEHGLIKEFAPEIENETRKVSKLVMEYLDIKSRLDLRNEEIVTIDGAYSKDLDDGVSLKINEAGNYVLGVHIADVSEFVREGMSLDCEALKRGNSVYLINHVVPMLPTLLSNELCSLNEGKDRLTLSCIMEMDRNAKVVDYKICESIIRSKARLVYDEVSDFIEDGKLSAKVKSHAEMLSNMWQLAECLRASREALGSVDFDIDEAEFEIDENGSPIDVFASERRSANRLIEEFMLIANKTVAEHYFWMEYPFIYRVHEKPLPEKVMELKAFLKGVGLSLPLNEGNVHPMALRKLLEEAQESNLMSLVSTVMVRSMQKAYYSPKCLGHYGLAFKQYCHFTSPIRRYSDLWIHRLIKYQMHSRLNADELSAYYDKAEAISKTVSDTERKAISMERELEKIKKAQYMERWIGFEATGVISGVTGFGFFVQLENTVEGLVRLDSLTDDYYDFDKENFKLIGSAKGKEYRLGDRVDVICTRVDTLIGTIDFRLC